MKTAMKPYVIMHRETGLCYEQMPGVWLWSKACEATHYANKYEVEYVIDLLVTLGIDRDNLVGMVHK